MERLFLTIITISLIAIVPLLSAIEANATQSCIVKQDQELEKTKLLPIIQDRTSLQKFLDSRVQIIGKYVVTKTWNPGINSNTAEFRGVYQQASIELEDGTLIPIIPPSNKLSLRPASEVANYNGKLVKVIGRIQLQPDNPTVKNSPQKVMLTTFEGLCLKQ
jgi:hypothetical protein